jgi:bifunctional enzyme CysN/CysC
VQLRDKLPKALLRFSTAGSVDDGKSTFIGRLLYDTGNIYDDHVAALKAKAEKSGDKKLPLALVTDGLRAEREQGITIDVAYRYFSTTKRRFILADSPGHEQYTRNMATAASTADLTIVLVDAKNGVLPQTKRHAFVAALLGVSRLLVAINKMDLVDCQESRFDELVEEFGAFAAKLGVKDVRFVPVIATDGDNIVRPSDRMPWYEGETVLGYLEDIYIAGDTNQVDFRFPVQWVIRHRDQFRGYAGTVQSGSLRVGEELVALPSQLTAQVTSILKRGTEEVTECTAGDAVAISLSREIDIARGSMLVRPNNIPKVTDRFQAMIIWCGEEPFIPGSKVVIRHTTQEVKAEISDIQYGIDIHDLHRKSKSQLDLNDIARVSVLCQSNLFIDPYQRNRSTGNFIVVDPITNKTIAAGMILDRDSIEQEKPKGPGVLHEAKSLVSLADKRAKWKVPPITLWLTGLSGSGKSTISQALEAEIFHKGGVVIRLDGDTLRSGLNSDLGFSDRDRSENIRRTAEIARLLNASGMLVVCSLISPLKEQRASARQIIGEGSFVEVYIKAPLDVCKVRDPHGLYARAKSGDIKEFTGVSSAYEAPDSADIVLETDTESVEVAVTRLLAAVESKE